jgi:hypothetical protein
MSSLGFGVMRWVSVGQRNGDAEDELGMGLHIIS